MSRTVSPALKPKKIVVITLRYLGDVLLTTPLLRSLREAFPEAQIDVLVYSNTAAMLEGNPDINHIITTPNRPKLTNYKYLLPRLFRRYDLAIATQTGDRPFLYALLAAPFRVAAVPQKNSKGWWKRFFIQRWSEFDNNDTHTVIQNLKLADLLGIASHYSLVAPRNNHIGKLEQKYDFLADHTAYVVLHAHPQWIFKRWTQQGWVEIGNALDRLGLRVVLTGGPAQKERQYVTDIAKELPKKTINLAGQVSLAELSLIIARAKLFIGPDTGITHLAAATGVPVIALYGPTNPVKWGPWPSGYEKNINPFLRVGSQKVNNICLLQGQTECVPCDFEGCDRHRQSHSRCLDTLLSERVERAIRQALQSV
jgi:heptosyltransferase-3